MSRESHSALLRYKARREGQPVADLPDATPRRRGPTHNTLPWKAARIASLVALFSAIAWWFIPQPPAPVDLTYEIDLAGAAEGQLAITLIAEGQLPDDLDLEFPPGVFGDAGNGVTPRSPSAHVLRADGRPGRPLDLEQTGDGWRLRTARQHRVGFIYHVDLARTSGLETDIRRHISTPVAGGVRVAGFEVFLEPAEVPVSSITVTVHNPEDLAVLVPWPALVHGAHTRTRLNGLAEAAEPAQDTPAAPAHIGAGQGFRPAAGGDGERPKPVLRRADSAALSSNLFYHPQDLADLNNALLICGHIRTATAQVHDCVIQYATDGEWLFPDEDVLDLVRSIARTETGFFGSAPTPQITVILAANEVNTADSFDVYGVHTGSSVLVMVRPDITWGELEEQAASVIAHEMFHGWLGEALGQRNDDTLWFTEGATTWFAARMLTAAGIWNPEHSRRMLYARLERDYVTSPLRGQMPVAEAAADVMADAGQVRYAYAGSVAACMALDQWLAEQSGKQRPLDEVLRHLYVQYAGQTLTRRMIEDAVAAVTGVDCGPWLEAYVYGKSALPPVDRLI